MDKNGKFKENVPMNLHVQIKDRLNNVLNDFEDLCETLDKLGITFKPEFESSNLNVLSKADENFDEKTKENDISADLLNIPAVTDTSNSISATLGADTTRYEEAKFRIEEMKTTSSKISETYASIFDTDISEFSDGNSETSSTAVNLSHSDLDELYEEISKSDFDESEFGGVEIHSDLGSMDRLSETTGNNVMYTYKDTDVSVTGDQTLENLELKFISFNNPKKDNGGLKLHNQNMIKAYKSLYTGQESNFDTLCSNISNSSRVDMEANNKEDEFFPTCGDTDISVTDDQISESLKLEWMSSKNSEKGNKGLRLHTKNMTKALKSPDNKQESNIGKLSINIRNFSSIDIGTTVIENEFVCATLYPENDLVTTVNAFERKENENSDTNQDFNLNHLASGGVKEGIENKGLCKNSNRAESEYLKSSDSDSDSCYSNLMISDSDAESFSSENACSDIIQENIFQTEDLRKEMNNNEYSSDLVQEGNIKVENSLYNYSGSIIHWEAQYGCKEAKVKKEVPENFVIPDENWSSPTLLAKSIGDPIGTSDDFASKGQMTESTNIGFDLYHLNEKLLENNQQSHIEEKSPKTVTLIAVRSILNNILSQPEYSSDLSKKKCQDTTTFSNEPPQNFSSCNSRRSSVGSDDPSDIESDLLDNIFKIILKCHPINASTGAEIKFCQTKRKKEVLSKRQAKNDENSNPSERNCDMDSQGVITFDYDDSLIKNSSEICGALISDYLNTAVKLNILLIKKAKDVSTEDYIQRLDTLHCLNDELGFLSAKLVIVINDSMKQFCEIDQNLRGNPQWRMRSLGLYYMGMLRICTALTKTLLQFCLEKQLELEEYETELLYYHECCN